MSKSTLGLLTIFIFFAFNINNAQTLSSRIVDSVTQKPVPYATVQLKNKGVITNEEGRFTFLIDNNIEEMDSLFISCIGYRTLKKPLKEFIENVIYLSPQAIELNTVIVSNKQYSAEDLIDLVKDNIVKNYNTDYSKKRLFFRETQKNHILKTDYTFVKSTIEELNKVFLDSVMRSIPKQSSYYTEVLCDLYGNHDEEKQKLHIIKASELYDKSNDLDLTKLEEKFNQIIRANVKPNSYFKIKSGLFGTKVEGEDFEEIFKTDIDSTDAAALKKELEKKKKDELERKTNFLKHKRNSLGRRMQGLFFMDDTDLNVIKKSRKYEFTLKNYTYIGDDAVYIVDFKPKGSADYKGSLYITSDDFAVIRVDYENIKPIKNFKLLGLSMNEYLDKGKMFFSKDKNGRYNLKYLEQERGVRVGIRRPLKIIEKNKIVKGRNKQNELFLKLDMATSSTAKHEVIVFDTEALSVSQFEAFKENSTVLPTYMPNYDPEFWKGYNIIEPNQAIKEFTSEEEITD